MNEEPLQHQRLQQTKGLDAFDKAWDTTMEKYFGKAEQQKKEQAQLKVVVDEKVVVEEEVLPIKEYLVSILNEETSPKKNTDNK